MRFSRLGGALLLWLGVSKAWASDPVDQNFGGPYAGGQMVLGQGSKVGNGSPGPAYLLAFDLGYGIKRDTWNRIELGLELGTGKASFTDKLSTGDLKVDLDLDLVMMVKAGYGYSLGDSAFGLFRVGAGIAQGSYSGSKGVRGGSSSGVATMIAWDAILPSSPTVDFVFGVSMRFFNFNFSDLPTNNQLQLNLPALNGGVRFRF